MRILITGNMGYVGPAITRHFRCRFPDATLLGFDAGLFANCLTTRGPLPEAQLDAQYFGDVRDMPHDLLAGVDAVIHLAAISNDPIGNRFEAATDDINRAATLRTAAIARAAGVRSFVFASSCSMYGMADAAARREDDALNPLTAYARSKVGAERGLAMMDGADMTVTCLRFATACGMSDRVRLDLVLNDFVACALSSGEISVLSDGTPWRPLIDVRDMARACEWAVLRSPDAGGQVLRINAGCETANYQVRDLATAVATSIPGTTVTINTTSPSDSRSYRVDFSLFRRLAPEHQPQFGLEASIQGLVSGLRSLGFADREFRRSDKVRLNVLSTLIASGELTPDLRWRRPDASTPRAA